MKKIYEAPTSELIDITYSSIMAESAVIEGTTPGNPIEWGGVDDGTNNPDANIATWDDFEDKL